MCEKELKQKLVRAQIIVALYWNKLYESMCDASDGAIRNILGQRRKKVFHSIYYARKTLNPAQIKYCDQKGVACYSLGV